MSGGLKHALKDRARGGLRVALGAMTPWPALREPVEGYSIILGAPWALRDLLSINLEFIARCETPRLVDVHVVFDRCFREGMPAFERTTMDQWGGRLPLRFHHYPKATGRLVERANISTFYNGLNIVTALSANRARAMILHDFDLYPTETAYFERLAEPVLAGGMRFAGVERTIYDGLTEADNIWGTWGLAMDAVWLRNTRKPAEIFHRRSTLPDGRRILLDPFSWLQLGTEKRTGVEAITLDHFCHVKNLCSTYLRLHSSKAIKVAWRLHYLLYLQDAAERGSARIEGLTEQMERASGRRLEIEGLDIDFAGVDPTCANVLDRELREMDRALFGEVRPAVDRFIGATRAFLGAASPRAASGAA